MSNRRLNCSLSSNTKQRNCFYEKVGTSGTKFGRETTAEVILVPKLRSALQKLNPDFDSGAVNPAIEALARDRSAMSLVRAKREVDKLLKDGVKVSFQSDDGDEIDETVRVIDWNNPGNNDSFLAPQLRAIRHVFEIRTRRYHRIPERYSGLPEIHVPFFCFHTDYLHSAKFSPDGSRVMSNGSTGQLKRWTASDGKLLNETRIGRVGNTALYSPHWQTHHHRQRRRNRERER